MGANRSNTRCLIKVDKFMMKLTNNLTIVGPLLCSCDARLTLVLKTISFTSNSINGKNESRHRAQSAHHLNGFLSRETHKERGPTAKRHPVRSQLSRRCVTAATSAAY